MLFTICGIEVNSEAQNLPTVTDIQPNSRVPQRAPIARILPTQDASFDVIGCESGESVDCSAGNDGDDHPIDAPTPSAIMFAVSEIKPN